MSEQKKQLIEVTLDKDHTHAGKQYAAGQKIYVTAAERIWLIGAKVVKANTPKEAFEK